MSGQEVFLRGLYELVSGEDQFNICENVFGSDQSTQSRAFKFFVNHIFENFYYLLTDNLNWWYEKGFIKKSQTAINNKLLELGMTYGNGMESPVFGFIDCNCMETCRVGGGPSGTDTERWDDNIQRAFYNGWKSVHGLKHQTVDLAYGLTIDMYGPTSLRRNDMRLLGASKLNQRLQSMQRGQIQQLIVYGDSIYPHLTHVTSCWKGENVSDEQRKLNGLMKSVRISIEWNYSVTSNLFGYLKNFNKLRLLTDCNCAKIYIVATFLRNCHVCIYGSISSSYFNLLLPSDMLEQYLQLV